MYGKTYNGIKHTQKTPTPSPQWSLRNEMLKFNIYQKHKLIGELFISVIVSALLV